MTDCPLEPVKHVRLTEDASLRDFQTLYGTMRTIEAMTQTARCTDAPKDTLCEIGAMVARVLKTVAAPKEG